MIRSVRPSVRPWSLSPSKAAKLQGTQCPVGRCVRTCARAPACPPALLYTYTHLPWSERLVGQGLEGGARAQLACGREGMNLPARSQPGGRVPAGGLCRRPAGHTPRSLSSSSRESLCGRTHPAWFRLLTTLRGMIHDLRDASRAGTGVRYAAKLTHELGPVPKRVPHKIPPHHRKMPEEKSTPGLDSNNGTHAAGFL